MHCLNRLGVKAREIGCCQKTQSALKTFFRFGLSPIGTVKSAARALSIRWAISWVHVYGNYKMVPISSLSDRQRDSCDGLFYACKAFKPCAGRDGVAMLKEDKVIGGWEFEKHGKTVRLIAVSTDKEEMGDFHSANEDSIAGRMFKAILEFATNHGCDRLSYTEWSPDFYGMMKRFEKEGLISKHWTHEEGRMHRILLDQWQ